MGFSSFGFLNFVAWQFGEKRVPDSEKNYLSQRRKGAKVGELDFGIFVVRLPKLCGLAPWRDKIRIRSRVFSRKGAKARSSEGRDTHGLPRSFANLFPNFASLAALREIFRVSVGVK